MPRQLPIVTYPAAILRQPTSDLTPEQARQLSALAQDMALTMEVADGIGLAAVQVGRAVRMAVVSGAVAKTAEHLVLVSPRLVRLSVWRSTFEEGCLSLPGVYGNVRRPAGATVRYLDLNGEAKELRATGMLVRVILHELDHLDGVLFIDRAKTLTQGAGLLETWQAKAGPNER